jgi:hypothetical protein
MPPKKTPSKTVVIERTVTTKETRTEYKPKSEPKKTGACYRCGRTSHWSPDCYATYHVDGSELSD